MWLVEILEQVVKAKPRTNLHDSFQEEEIQLEDILYDGALENDLERKYIERGEYDQI